jgi:hypothetical protein
MNLHESVKFAAALRLLPMPSQNDAETHPKKAIPACHTALPDRHPGTAKGGIRDHRNSKAFVWDDPGQPQKRLPGRRRAGSERIKRIQY